MVWMGVRDDDRVDVRRAQANRPEVFEDAAAIRTHRLARASLDQYPPAAGFDQQRVEIKRHVVRGEKCAPEHRLELRLGRIAGIDTRRAANDTVTQDRCPDVADTEAVAAGIAIRRGCGLSLRAAGTANDRDDRTRCACDGGQHDGASVEGEGIHRSSLAVGRTCFIPAAGPEGPASGHRPAARVSYPYGNHDMRPLSR